MALTATLSVNPSSVQMPDADSVTVLCTVTNTGATTLYLRQAKVWIASPSAASASLGQPSGPWPKTLPAGQSININWGAAFFEPDTFTLAAYITDVYEAVSVTPTPVSVTVTGQVYKDPGLGPWRDDVTLSEVTAEGSATKKTLAAWTSTLAVEGGSIPVTSTGSTTARTVADRFADVVNVKDFGAVGNALTDDTAAIQAAIDYAASSGKRAVRFPAGWYTVSDTVKVVEYVTNLIGEGAYATILSWKSGATGTGKAYLRPQSKHFTVTGISLQGTEVSVPDTGIDLYADGTEKMFQWCKLEDIQIGTNGFAPTVGLWSHDPPSGQQHEFLQIKRCNINGHQTGVWWNKPHCDYWNFESSYLGYLISDGTGAAVRISGNQASAAGPRFKQTWWIGPTNGVGLLIGTAADTTGIQNNLVLDAAGSEGPYEVIRLGWGNLKMVVDGVGLNNHYYCSIALNNTLAVESRGCDRAVITGEPIFRGLGAVNWYSRSDQFWLDSVAQYVAPFDTFYAQASSAATTRLVVENTTGDLRNSPLDINAKSYYTAGISALRVSPQQNGDTYPVAQFTQADRTTKVLEVLSSNKIGFFGATPVARQATATGTDSAKIAALITALQNLGLMS